MFGIISLFILLECGIISENVFYYDSDRYNLDITYYIQVETTIKIFDLVFIEGKLVNYAVQEKNEFIFWPYFIDYIVGVGIEYENIRIGYIHNCGHPINAFNSYIYKDDKGFNKIYLKYEILIE